MRKMRPKTKVYKKPGEKVYGDLNLKKVREDADLDFAHFTYQRGMCSCCYGPADLPAKYWKNGIVRKDDDAEYILFKNAYNGSGIVTKNDIIENYTCIEWHIKSKEKLDLVCQMLMEQLGDGYVVGKPLTSMRCILILTKSDFKDSEKQKDNNYLFLTAKENQCC